MPSSTPRSPVLNFGHGWLQLIVHEPDHLHDVLVPAFPRHLQLTLDFLRHLRRVIGYLQAPVLDQGNLDGDRPPLVVAPEDLGIIAP